MRGRIKTSKYIKFATLIALSEKAIKKFAIDFYSFDYFQTFL